MRGGSFKDVDMLYLHVATLKIVNKGVTLYGIEITSRLPCLNNHG
jgi:hypothetical protein